jgi:hypothetical protein
MALTAYSALSPAIGLFVTVTSVMRSIIAGLMPASRHQDHAALPYADDVSSGAKLLRLAPPASIASCAQRS